MRADPPALLGALTRDGLGLVQRSVGAAALERRRAARSSAAPASRTPERAARAAPKPAAAPIAGAPLTTISRMAFATSDAVRQVR